MYSFLLHSHKGLRLLITFMAFATLFVLIKGLVTKAKWDKTPKILMAIYAGLLDLQLLVGLLLYFVYSPLTKVAFRDFGAAMKVQELRFYAVEHIILMLVAIVVAHIGSRVGKRDVPDLTKWKGTMVWLSISIIMIVAAIPWNRAWM